MKAQVWVDKGFTRISSVFPDGSEEHSIVGEGRRYRWYNDDLSFFETAAEERDDDLMQRIPTYEDILALDPGSITAAGYEKRSGIPCIFVEVEEKELGYRERYWVSVERGLLVAAETMKESRLLLRVSAYSVEIPVRSGNVFTLPGGKVLHRS